MNNRAIVIDTETSDTEGTGTKADKSVMVLPMIKDSCAGCATGCDKQGAAFAVSNPLNLPVKKGTIVILSLSKRALAIQGIVSLLFPFLCSILGFLLGGHFGFSEEMKAVLVLIMLACSSLIVFLVTRFHPMTGKPQIIEIY